MDTQAVPRFPLIFHQGELEGLYRGRGKFSPGALKRRLAEKCLQCILLSWHGIATREPEEVYRHVRLKRFCRPRYRGTSYIALVYAYQGRMWRHSFRFERFEHDAKGGIYGTLIFNRRRSIIG